MDLARAWRVEPLSGHRRDAFLGFLDHERGRAFADNPEWSACYCHYFHVAPPLDFDAMDATTNRVAMSARIETGEMEGYLAFDDAGSVVGWLNAQPRPKLRHCFARLGVEPPPLTVPPERAAVVICFVIDPALRGRGIARALLDAALVDLAARGIRVVDAFPSRVASDAAHHFRGPEALFASTGFTTIGETERLRIVRRELP